VSRSADPLDLLGDPTRRKILELLQSRARAVVEIADELPVSRPAVSRHLRVMLDAGLVECQADGTRRVYAIRREGFASVAAYWDGFWTGALGNYKHIAEHRHREKQ
jgi:predicted transcriptional regulator